jgi:hypothetical protein
LEHIGSSLTFGRGGPDSVQKIRLDSELFRIRGNDEACLPVFDSPQNDRFGFVGHALFASGLPSKLLANAGARAEKPVKIGFFAGNLNTQYQIHGLVPHRAIAAYIPARISFGSLNPDHIHGLRGKPCRNEL